MIEEPVTKKFRVVNELDFRKDEFKDAKVEDYEFDSTGELVRKDRFEKSMRSIAMALGLNFRTGWKCSDVVEGVEALTDMLEKLNNGGAVNPVGECIHKLQALGSEQWEIQQ